MRLPPTLTLATRNAHKLREFERLLAPAQITITPLPEGIELPPEVGETYAANALAKAQAAAAATGQMTIADDSGIEAEALGGRPGVRSARYAGPRADDEENLAKLEREVTPGSALRYVCVLALVDSSPARVGERLFTGDCPGRMAPARGGRRGFGYDPVFVPDGVSPARTMAELADAGKDRISHRGRAVAALLAWARGESS